jgi:hypothetical protein
MSLFQKRRIVNPSVGEMTVALRIAPGMRVEVMLTAINLDNEALLKADKIDNVA